MMKVAAVEFTDAMLSDIHSRHRYMEMIQKYIVRAVDNGADLLVFPGFTGLVYQLLELGKPNLQQAITKICHEEFICGIAELSRKYGLLICPGSYWERQGEDILHTSCLLQSGHLLLEQRQLYLAKWESQLGLSRGRDVDLIDINGWKMGIMLSTDVFYPLAARKLALMGADIVLSPVGFVGERNSWLQLSGVWQKAQLNHFFAIESAFNLNWARSLPSSRSGR